MHIGAAVDRLILRDCEEREVWGCIPQTLRLGGQGHICAREMEGQLRLGPGRSGIDPPRAGSRTSQLII